MDNKDTMALQRCGMRYAESGSEVQSLIDKVIEAPVRSADGIVLVHNETRVFTNNLDRGVVDLSRLSYEWHRGENRWVPWFYVNLDTDYKGNPMKDSSMQSDDRVATRFDGRKA